ncbi:hypothetical protein KAH27_04065 [bacterium]|nr:hypothetical protein [bacterium]
MKTITIFLIGFVLISANFSLGMKVHQDSDFTGKIITNISSAFSVTGVFTYVPEASANEPVPYWQMTNEIDAAAIPTTSIVSGECDTNRTDILFSTNFTINSVYIYQDSAASQGIFLYTNNIIFDSFSFSSQNASHSFSIGVGQFDRLGIASSNTASIIDFCFQGKRN